MKKIIFRILVWGVPALILYFITDTLIAAGTFKTINPHFEGSVEKIGLTIAGPEDIAIDQATGLAFVASDDRRANFTAPGSVPGAMYLINLKDSLPVLRDITPKTPKNFHPHGISLFRTQDARLLLFVVSHRKQSGGDAVERFEWQKDSLVHLETIVDQAIMTAPNDLVAVGERSFYVTNDHYYAEYGVGRALEEYLQRAISYVLYFDGDSFRTVADGIAYANGINVSPDGGRIYVASTTGRKLFTYLRKPDGLLEQDRVIDLNTGVDNIDVTPDGDLWIGCHPQMLKYVAHSNDAKKRSPSQIIRVTPDGTVKEIFLNDGVDYSGSTVGAVYGQQLLIGSVFEPSFLLCRME